MGNNVLFTVGADLVQRTVTKHFMAALIRIQWHMPALQWHELIINCAKIGNTLLTTFCRRRRPIVKNYFSGSLEYFARLWDVYYVVLVAHHLFELVIN